MMLPIHGACVCFSLFIDVSTSDGSMDGRSMVEVVLGSSCES